MREYDEMIEALKIFDKYEHIQALSAEHDIIYAGPSPSQVTDEDVTRLEELGWHAEMEYDCFYKFV